LVQQAPVPLIAGSARVDAALRLFASWLGQKGHNAEADAARDMGSRSACGVEQELPGPVGERNLYELHPRGRILVAAATIAGLYRQLAAVLATGNDAVIDGKDAFAAALAGLPPQVTARISWTDRWESDGPFAGALVEGDEQRILDANRRIAALPGPLIIVQAAKPAELAADASAICLNWLQEEVSTSINTAAAGGNASLMTIG
jgi:RHH-type proline utilization regulon transcriptional repressor/proline dehydrogenase/delta 1-pyrroline-5-carboxylate dehydrogenase